MTYSPKPSGKGAVAAGSPLTVQAGVHTLRTGGNAVDAAVAASLMACVVEPLLTGLGGAGMAMVRMDDRVDSWDLFADVPGINTPDGAPPPMHTVEIDFGPTTQAFHVGPPSVAVPGMPAGLHAMHAAHGRLPFADLVAPAAKVAREGYPVSLGFARPFCTASSTSPTTAWTRRPRSRHRAYTSKTACCTWRATGARRAPWRRSPQPGRRSNASTGRTCSSVA